MNRFELYKDYKESEIERCRHENSTCERSDYGIGVAGYDFIVLYTGGDVISFIRIHQPDKEWIYKCIYTDFNTSNPIKELELTIQSITNTCNSKVKSLEIELEHTKQLLTEATNGRT
jgi:hypothetical protein